jgi:integrase/recombinase XerC
MSVASNIVTNAQRSLTTYPENRMADALALNALIQSWLLALDAENKSDRTLDNYLEAMTLLTRWLVDEGKPHGPEDVTTTVLREWLVHLEETRSAATARTRWTALRNFWAWAHEEGEIPANPMALVKPPAIPEKLVDFLDVDQLKAVIAACDGPRLVDRRDAAIILLYADSGGRLSEIARADLANLDLRDRSLLVMGKGARERLLPFGARTARAIDRYLRVRARQPYAESRWLWLSGKDGRAMTGNGVHQMLKRRGAAAGVPELHAHMFRHGFADAWLSSGGSETDLMEIAGWRSRQMLNRYGAPAGGPCEGVLSGPLADGQPLAARSPRVVCAGAGGLLGGAGGGVRAWGRARARPAGRSGC